MTTHRGAWSARAGVVVALTAGALVTLPAAPALAEAPTVTIVNLPSATLQSGAETTVSFSVQNNNENASSFSVEVEGFDGLSCIEGCDPTQAIAPGATQPFNAKLKAGEVAAGQQKVGQLTISANGPNNDDGEASVQMTVKGAAAPPPPPQQQTVKEVSGRVIDERTGDPVDNAFVLLKDAKNKTFDTYTNEAGTYRFTGSADNPIAPGALQIGAQKDDVNDTRQINASANQRLTNVRLTLKITVAPTASPTPDAALPTGELTPDAGIPTEQPATPGDQVAASDSDSGGMGSWLVVLGGGLLVALGVGGIVWVLVRRRESGDDEDEAATGVRPAVPVGGAGMGAAGGYGDSTRMVPRAARDPLADAPTMLHSRAPVDEFPDPYGAPMPAQPPGYGAGYGQPTQQYGGPAASPQPPYGGAGGGAYGGYDAPSSGGGYAPSGTPTYGGAPAGGPPQAYDDRYDEPTGRYQAANGSGYGAQSGYEPPPADYRGGYDQQQPGGGYGGYQDRGYEGYDQPRGYSGGYDQGGYDQQPAGGGHDRVPPQRGGYDQGGYGPNGYDQQPPPGGAYYPEDDQQQPGGRARHGTPQGRGDRRQLDWLDD